MNRVLLWLLPLLLMSIGCLGGCGSQSQPADNTIVSPAATTYNIPRLHDIAIDGRGEDWADGGYRVDIVTSSRLQARAPEDFEPTFRLGWNERGLLVLADVRDNQFTEAAKADELYWGDGIELFLQPRPGDPNVVQAVISPGMAGDQPQVRHVFFDKRKDEGLKKLPLSVQAQRTKITGGYRMEILMPWSCLAIKPEVGQEIGLQLFFDDRDGEGGELFNAVWYHATAAPVWSPENVHTVRLSEAASSPERARAHAIFSTPGRLQVQVLATRELAGQSAQLSLDRAEGGTCVLSRDVRPRGEFGLVVPAHFRAARNVKAEVDIGDEATCSAILNTAARRCYFISTVDGYRQEYELYLPQVLAEHQALPQKRPVCFITVGYGMGTFPFAREVREWADKHGWILVNFDGRQTLHYNGSAETDFDQLLHRELAALVDPARVFMAGPSQGASGSFGLGARHPDWFASVGGSGGFLDYNEWYPRWHGENDKNGQRPRQFNGPEYQRRSAITYSVRDTGGMCLWLRPYIHTGEYDEINRQWASRGLSAELATLGISHQYAETVCGGHCQGYSDVEYLEYFRTHATPIDPTVPKVHISTNRLEYAQMRWARVTSLLSREKPCHLIAVLDSQKKALRIQASDEVGQAEFNLTPALLQAWKLDGQSEITLILTDTANQAKPQELKAPLTLAASEPVAPLVVHRVAAGQPWQLGPLPRQGLWKQPGVEGPIGHVWSVPFTVVYGTGGTPQQQKAARDDAAGLAEYYYHTHKARIEAVADKDVTDAMRRTRSLVLLGTADTNSQLAAAKAQSPTWPYMASEGKLGLSGRTFDAATHDMAAIFPSPWNRSGYVVVLTSGDLPLGLGWRAPFWLPDYIVWKKPTPQDPKDKQRDVALSGYLNEQWQAR